jgi:hypothetical protein
LYLPWSTTVEKVSNEHSANGKQEKLGEWMTSSFISTLVSFPPVNNFAEVAPLIVSQWNIGKIYRREKREQHVLVMPRDEN